jgi:signal transduction histidine kinase
VEVLKRTAAHSPHAITTALQRIEDSTKAQSRLVDDLLDVTAVAKGKVRLAMQQVPLGDLVRNSVEDVALPASKRDVTVRLEQADDCTVVADVQRLRQVMANLLQNAVKFSHEGGIVSVSVQCTPTRATVDVSDNGIGIEPSMLARIFERFAQGHAQHTHSNDGVGLGLTIAKRLVEANGGTIEAFSQGPGTGATFRVTLPLNPQQSRETDTNSADYF